MIESNSSPIRSERYLGELDAPKDKHPESMMKELFRPYIMPVFVTFHILGLALGGVAVDLKAFLKRTLNPREQLIKTEDPKL